jgi:tetratricopeptide (TPR) repeat protein
VSVLDELELRASYEARRALGPRALVDWAVDRLPATPRSRARAECVRGALCAALETEREGAVSLLSALLGEGPRVEPGPLLAACEAACDAARDPALALEVAEALERLERRPEATLAVAILAERAGRTELALASYARAAEASEALGDADGALDARLELARARLVAGRAAEALELVAELPEETVARLDGRAKLVVARAWLGASGRYRRAAAIELASEVLDTSPALDPEARAALRLVCEHVDRVGPALSEPELERLGALVTRARARGHAEGLVGELLGALASRAALCRAAPPEREAEAARAALASEGGRGRLERARSVRDGGTPGPRPADPRALPEWLALCAIVHLRARRLGEARRSLEELAALTPDHAPGPDVAAWTALRRAAPERALRDVVTALGQRWLGTDGVAPARGFVDLAAVLERAGLDELAGQALARARARHEPDARPLAIQHAIRRAWAEYDRGARREARALLHAALLDARTGTGSRKS